ncbi:MAG: hypothetical protein RIT26_384 [Pseudomonadota bacterium]
MVMTIGEAEVRQSMILLRRERELARLLTVDWPRLLDQMERYGLSVELEACFVRDGAELQWRVTCETRGALWGYSCVLNHPDCTFVLRDSLGITHIMSAPNLVQILFDKIYNQTRQAPLSPPGPLGLQHPA